jgi:hypothetical protein
MKPSFALTFADDAIALLHRTSRGWMEIGSVSIDDPKMEASLAYLRGSALGLEPRGMTTKLVIPNSQIKYLTLLAAGPDAASRRAQIRRELEGKTPYAVDDLVFDWWGKGPSVQVAVVARETLVEAEAFATANRLNPLSFVAIPEAGQFGAEPWFGPTALAERLLAPGEKVDRDQDPIQSAGRLPRMDPPAETALPAGDEPQGTTSDDLPAPLADAITAVPELPPLQAADVAQPETAAESQIEVVDVPAPPQDAPPEGAPAGARAAAVAVAIPPDVGIPDLPAPAMDVTADRIPDETDGGLPAKPAPRTPRITPAIPASETDAIRVVSDPRLGKKAAPSPRAGAKGAAPKTPEMSRSGPSGPGRMTSFPSGSAQGAKLAVSDSDWPLERVTAAARTGQARDDLARISPVITAPGIPMPRDRKLSVVPKPDVDAGPDKAGKRTEANPALAPFGKRPVQRGKPRFLGLILTGILLLLLAAVAAWSSYLIASTFGKEEPAVAVAAGDAPAGDAIIAAPLPVAAPETAAAAADPALTTPQAGEANPADVPAATDEMLADLQDPADFAAVPALEAEPEAAVAALTSAEAAADPEPVVERATVAQPATTAVDGRNPGAEPQDEILLAMIDPDIPTSDAVALAVPGTATDPVPPSQPAPPPFGTLYQFDADGRIVPTAEGIITPEGVLLVAGPPPRIPPQRPEVPVQPVADAAGVTPEAAAVAEVAPVVYADPALADARPRLRPADLVPPEIAAPDDGAELTTAPTGRLSSLKPRARPPELLAAADAALQAETAAAQAAAASLVASADAGGGSPLAVAVSRKPAARPEQANAPDNAAIDAAVSVAAADASLVPDTAVLAPAKPAVPAPEPQPVLAAKPTADDPEAVEIDEPEIVSAAPSIPTRASVAKQATYKNSINLSKVNLIGVYGTSSNRYAMVRQANGRFVKVEVGDRVDGGRVAAISDRELRYVKNGTTLTLEMPKG